MLASISRTTAVEYSRHHNSYSDGSPEYSADRAFALSRKELGFGFKMDAGNLVNPKEHEYNEEEEEEEEEYEDHEDEEVRTFTGFVLVPESNLFEFLQSACEKSDHGTAEAFDYLLDKRLFARSKDAYDRSISQLCAATLKDLRARSWDKMPDYKKENASKASLGIARGCLTINDASMFKEAVSYATGVFPSEFWHSLRRTVDSLDFQPLTPRFVSFTQDSKANADSNSLELIVGRYVSFDLRFRALSDFLGFELNRGSRSLIDGDEEHEEVLEWCLGQLDSLLDDQQCALTDPRLVLQLATLKGGDDYVLQR